MSFGARLSAVLDTRGSLCVGIDPHPALLDAWDLPDDVDGLARFAETCVDAFSDTVAVLKPQSAFFEAYGSAGIAVLERTVAAGRANGALVVLDVKRGDIGSTMAAYARAYLADGAPLAADAITVSPYLGFGSLQPALDLVASGETGVFVLAATSNPERAQVQNARGDDGRTAAQTVIDHAATVNAGAAPLGSVGVVVGATIPPGTVDLSALNGPILAPGVGTQGGTAASVREIFGPATRNVIPSVSRDVLQHGPDIRELNEAAQRLVDDFAFLRGTQT